MADVKISALADLTTPVGTDYVPVVDASAAATRRLYLSRFLTVYNVLNYGAVGDGVTNDTTAIQAAIDACYAAGGGEVFFPAPHTYIVDQLLVASGVSLVGQGWTSVLKTIATKNQGQVVWILNKTDCSVRDLAMDGNYPTVPGTIDWGTKLISIYGSSRVLVQNCYLHDNGYHAVVVSGSNDVKVLGCSMIETDTGVYTAALTNTNLTVMGCHIEGGASEGGSFHHTTAGTKDVNLVFVGNTVRDKGGGVQISLSQGFNISDNIFESINGGSGIGSLTNSGVTPIEGIISNNIIRDVDYMGISGSWTDTVISGNNILRTGSGHGIDIGSSSSRCQVSENIITDPGTVANICGIKLTTCANCVVKNNVCRDTRGVSKLMLAGVRIYGATGSVVMGNTVYGGTYGIRNTTSTDAIVRDNVVTDLAAPLSTESGAAIAYGNVGSGGYPRDGSGSTAPGHFTGTGTPEAVVTAPIGSTFRRTNGGANTTFYVKESGTGSTGWIAK